MMRNYNDPLYKNWRQNVKKRDKNTCRWPNCTTRIKLHAHHINKWSDFPGLRYHIDNGITLCKYHHQLIQNNEENYSGFFFKLIAQSKKT